MGQWTDIILSMSVMEENDERIAEVDAYFQPDQAPGRYDITLSEETRVGVGVYVGSYKNFDLAAFLRHINTVVKWSDPENVQVFIKLDGEQQFKIVHGVQAFDGRFVDRDQLLSDAEYLLEQFPENDDALTWLKEYREFKKERDDH